MDSVFLDEPSGNFRKPSGAEVGDDVVIQLPHHSGYVRFGSLTFRDDQILTPELLRSVFEGFFVFKETVSRTPPQAEIPILGDFLRERQALLAGTFAPVLALQISRTLPELAVLALIEVKLPTKQRVFICHTATLPEVA